MLMKGRKRNKRDKDVYLSSRLSSEVSSWVLKPVLIVLRRRETMCAILKFILELPLETFV